MKSPSPFNPLDPGQPLDDAPVQPTPGRSATPLYPIPPVGPPPVGQPPAGPPPVAPLSPGTPPPPRPPDLPAPAAFTPSPIFERPRPKLRPPPEGPSLLRRILPWVVLAALLNFGWMKYGQQLLDYANGKTDVMIPAPGGRAPEPEVLIPLHSTDGRTIQAKILVITDKSVFIRREDGQTFDLPLERLTPESKERIENYRLARIHRGTP